MAAADAYVEQLCEHCFIVRVGACGPFPASYLYSVTCVIRGEYAEVVGFDHPKVSRSDFELIGRKINEATGKLVVFVRAGPPLTRWVQIHPAQIGGKIRIRRQ